MASREAAAALRLLPLPARRYAEGRPKGFRGVLVLLLLAGDHVMGKRMGGRGRRGGRGGGGGRWGGRGRSRGELDDGGGVAAVGGLGEGGLHGCDEVGLVVMVRVGFPLRGVGGLGGGGWRGGYRGWRAEGLQARVDSGVGAGLRGGGGRRRGAAAHGTAVAAVATDFGTVLGQSLRSSHSSQHPHWTDEALLVRGQQRGSRRRRSLLRRRRGGVWLHLATPAHYRAWPVIG